MKRSLPMLFVAALTLLTGSANRAPSMLKGMTAMRFLAALTILTAISTSAQMYDEHHRRSSLESKRISASAQECTYDADPLTGTVAVTCRPLFDPNGDGVVDFADFVYLYSYVYLAGPDPIGSGDANGDCVVDPADIIYLIAYLYEDGPAPTPSC